MTKGLWIAFRRSDRLIKERQGITCLCALLSSGTGPRGFIDHDQAPLKKSQRRNSGN